MNAKSSNTPWVDPDDAPDMSGVDLTAGTWLVEGKTVTAEEGQAAIRKARGRPSVANKKRIMSIRIDPSILERWQASGKGWQTRASELLAKNAP